MIHYQITHTTTTSTASRSRYVRTSRTSRRGFATGSAPNRTCSPSPRSAVIEERIDYFGNPVEYFTVQEPHRELTVKVEHRIAVEPRAWPEAAALRRGSHSRLPAARSFTRMAGCLPVRVRLALRAAGGSVCRFREGVLHDRSADSRGRTRPDATHSYEFAYDPQATTLATPVAEVFEQRHGVCQDFAHFQLACVRSLASPPST